jgi:predicted dehydrogenase
VLFSPKTHAMNRLRLGVIGFGIFGAWHAKAYAGYERAELRAVSDINPDSRKSAEETYGVPTFENYADLLALPEIDAVSIVVPDHLHRNVCLAAANAKKHILVEKPLAIRSSDAQAIVEACEKNSIRLMVDFANRWNPPYVIARSKIIAGELGEILYANMRLDDTLFVPTEMLSWARSSSVAWFLGSHTADLLGWLLDQEITSVSSIASKGSLVARGIDTEDFFMTRLAFSGGAVANMQNSWVLPRGNATLFEFVSEVVGTNGRIQIDTSQPNLIKVINQNSVSHPDSMMFYEDDGLQQGFGYKPMQHFVDSLMDDRDFRVTVADALRNVLVLEAIHDSAAQNGKLIPI